MAAFSKNGDAETVYMLMMGCSEYVSHFKRIKNFNTLNMIVKSLFSTRMLMECSFDMCYDFEVFVNENRLWLMLYEI